MDVNSFTNSTIVKNKADEDLLKSEYPNMDFGDEDEEDSYIKVDEVLFLLDGDNEEIFETYKVLAMYLDEGFAINTNLMIALCKEACMPLQESCTLLKYIHSGYSPILIGYMNEQKSPKPTP